MYQNMRLLCSLETSTNPNLIPDPNHLLPFFFFLTFYRGMGNSKKSNPEEDDNRKGRIRRCSTIKDTCIQFLVFSPKDVYTKNHSELLYKHLLCKTLRLN